MKPTELSRSSGRKVYLEAARILAAFFVIFNHTGASGFFLFAQRPWGSAAFWVYLFFFGDLLHVRAPVLHDLRRTDAAPGQ